MNKIKEIFHTEKATDAHGVETSSNDPYHNVTNSSHTTTGGLHGANSATGAHASNLTTGTGNHGTTTSTTGAHSGGLGANTSGVPGVNHDKQLPVQEGVKGRTEEGTALRTATAGSGKDFTNPHSVGHGTVKGATEVDPAHATHTREHLAAVTHENVRHTEVEEVERQKEHERHIHHVQHHVQPVHDKQVNEEVHHNKVIPKTTIHEKHVNTDVDAANFAKLGAHHKDTVTHAPTDRKVVDLGERVHETVQHHVHNVVQPVIEKEVHDQHRIHTVIPSHHISHEAPIIHQSATAAPVHISDFLKNGGVLDSKTTHANANVLNTGDCERTVDGPGESLAQKLHLKSGTTSNQHTDDTRI